MSTSQALAARCGALKMYMARDAARIVSLFADTPVERIERFASRIISEIKSMDDGSQYLNRSIAIGRIRLNACVSCMADVDDGKLVIETIADFELEIYEGQRGETARVTFKTINGITDFNGGMRKIRCSRSRTTGTLSASAPAPNAAS